jgi:hypothetical protein
MDQLLKILKISALVALILVLVVLSVPTLKGVFVIIHFTSTLQAWCLVQVLFLSFAIAAHMLLGRMSAVLQIVVPETGPISSGFISAIEPLRC